MDIPQSKLRKKVHLLFYIGLIGQFAFALYIALYLLLNAVTGNMESWNEHMAHGIIEGDKIGNFSLVAHIILALTITVGGPLQFIPVLRGKYKQFHRWNGRIYIMSTMLTSIFACWLIWSRPVIIGGTSGLIGNTVNAILIIVFGSLTWYYAVRRKYDVHRDWAIRTYIVVSGVWFFRIMFGTWLLVTGFTAPGVDENLTGWFAKVLYFGSYLIPLLIVETYLRLKTSSNVKLIKYYTWAIMLLCPLLIAGTLVTAKVFWLT